MADAMWRAAKGAGVGNVFLERVTVPEPGPHEVLSRTRVSLISRGSELWRRYVLEEAVNPDIMGYSTAGVVQQVGAGVTGFAPGDRVAVTAPHAEYSLRAVDAEDPDPRVIHLRPELSFDAGYVSSPGDQCRLLGPGARHHRAGSGCGAGTGPGG